MSTKTAKNKINIVEVLKEYVSQIEGSRLIAIDTNKPAAITENGESDPVKIGTDKLFYGIDKKYLVRVKYGRNVSNLWIKSGTKVVDFLRFLCESHEPTKADYRVLKEYVLTVNNIALPNEGTDDLLLCEVLKIYDATGMPFLFPIPLDIHIRKNVFFVEYQTPYEPKTLREMLISSVKNHDLTTDQQNKTISYLCSCGPEKVNLKKVRRLIRKVESKIPQLPQIPSSMRPLLFTLPLRTLSLEMLARMNVSVSTRSYNDGEDEGEIEEVGEERRSPFGFCVSGSIVPFQFVLGEEGGDAIKKSGIKGGEFVRLSFSTPTRKMTKKGLDFGFGEMEITRECYDDEVELTCTTETENGRAFISEGHDEVKEESEKLYSKLDVMNKKMKQYYISLEKFRKEEKIRHERVKRAKESRIKKSGDHSIKVKVKSDAKVDEVVVEKTALVEELKVKYAIKLNAALDDFDFFFLGKEMRDEFNLDSFPLNEGDTVTCKQSRKKLIFDELEKNRKERDVLEKEIGKFRFFGEIVCYIPELDFRYVLKIGRSLFNVGQLIKKVMEITKARGKKKVQVFQGFKEVRERERLNYGREYVVYFLSDMKKKKDLMKVVVKTNVSVEKCYVNRHSTVSGLKYQIYLKNTNYDPQRLVLKTFNGFLMQDQEKLSYYKIDDGSLVILSLRQYDPLRVIMERSALRGGKKEILMLSPPMRFEEEMKTESYEDEEEEQGSRKTGRSKKTKKKTKAYQVREENIRNQISFESRFKSPIMELGIRVREEETGLQKIQRHVNFKKPVKLIIKEPPEFFCPQSSKVVCYNEKNDFWEDLAEFKKTKRGEYFADIPHFTNVSVQSTRECLCFTIDTNHLTSGYNYDFTNLQHASDRNHVRGNLDYTRPCGWMRFALRVLGRYENDTWIKGGGSGGYGTWPVAYHGTKNYAVAPILESFLLRHGARQVGSPTGRSIYLSKDPTYAEVYTNPFTKDGRRYKVMFQARVRTGGWTEQTEKRTSYANEREWLFEDPQDIRLYGICVKQM